jgi:uncharacterized protein (DUF433 family)
LVVRQQVGVLVGWSWKEERLNGTRVFVGTLVPVRALLDYLEAGDPLDEFLEDFPSVTRGQAVAALRLAGQMLVAHANLA